MDRKKAFHKLFEAYSFDYPPTSKKHQQFINKNEEDIIDIIEKERFAQLVGHLKSAEAVNRSVFLLNNIYLIYTMFINGL
jgi:hypothetical protein